MNTILDKANIEKSTLIFRHIDSQKDGHLTIDQLAQTFPTVSEKEMSEIMYSLDLDKNGYIDFNEWKSATCVDMETLSKTMIK